MAAPNNAIEALRAEYRELIAKARAVEVALRALEAAYGVARPTETPSASEQPARPAAYKAAPGGPTEAIRAVVRENPGITRIAVVERALPLMTTTAGDPKRSLQETVRTLIHRGKIVERDGGIYLP